MLLILSAVLIGFILGVNLENLFSNGTYRLFLKSEELNGECLRAKDDLIISLRTKSDYYKKAYDDTILEHIKLMKLMNRRK